VGLIEFKPPKWLLAATFLVLSVAGWLVIEALLWLNAHLHLRWTP